MKNVAVLMTVFNRIEKTLLCLESLFSAAPVEGLSFKVFITDDGSSDGTKEKIAERFPDHHIEILQGDGNLYWNGGMNFSWRHAIAEGGFDGYLWLNNDSVVFDNLLISGLYSINLKYLMGAFKTVRRAMGTLRMFLRMSLNRRAFFAINTVMAVEIMIIHI